MPDYSKHSDNSADFPDKKNDVGATSVHKDAYNPSDVHSWRATSVFSPAADTKNPKKPEHVTKDGETATSIAESVLGKGASPTELKELTRKLAKANDVSPDHKFPAGVGLHIPPSLAKLFPQKAENSGQPKDALVFTPGTDATLYGKALDGRDRNSKAALDLSNPFDKRIGRQKFGDDDDTIRAKSERQLSKHNRDAQAHRPPSSLPDNEYPVLDDPLKLSLPHDAPVMPSPALTAPERRADLTASLSDAIALHDFLSEPDKAVKLLSTKSDAQRADIDSEYSSYFSGHTLESDYSQKLSDRQLADFRGALHRKDGDISSQNSDRVFSALTEASSGSWSGRSTDQIEKDLRDSARTSDPQKLADDYLHDYGRIITDDVALNKNISPETKAAFQIYMNRGADGPDNFSIAEQAIKSKNLDMLSEAMQDPRVRSVYDTVNGQAVLKSTFSSDSQRALDLAKFGKLSTEHGLDASAGFLGTDTKTADMSMKLMSPQEVSNYFIGKNQTDATVKLSADDIARLATMTDQEKQDAKAYFTTIHDHLSKLARPDTWDQSQADILRFEDMAATKSGSLVGELQHHWGNLYNSGMGEIKNDVASMSQKDWADGRAHPERRDQLERMLVALNKSPEEYKSTLDLYDKKIAENDWPKADRTGRGDVLLEKLDENKRLLSENDRRGVICDLMEAARRDPALRDHLQHPSTEEDRAFAKDFKDHVTNLIGADDYKSIIQPYIDNGSIPLEQSAKWNFTSETVGQRLNLLHNVNDDRQPDVKFMIESIGQASAEDKRRLLSVDPANKPFQDSVFKGMSEHEISVAYQVAGQEGGVHDEDRLRLAVLKSNGADSVDKTISSVGVTDKARADYARKYTNSLDADALNAASDTTKIQRALSSENDAVSQFNQAREEASQTRSGFGNWFATHVYGSSADAQLNDATNQHADMIIAAQNISNNVKPEDLQKMVDTMQQGVDNNKEAKAAAGEFVKNSALAVGTVAAVIASGGTASVPLVAAFAVSGAVANVGSKALFQGRDYDPTLTQLGTDAAIGGISGAVSAIGPAQFVKVIGFAGAAVKDGVATSISEGFQVSAASGYKLTGSQVFSEAATADLNKAATQIMHESLIGGEKRLNTIALKKAVEAAIPVSGLGISSLERAGMVSVMTQRLERNITEQMVLQSQRMFGNLAKAPEFEMMSTTQRIGTRLALNGMAGAGASGITSGGEALAVVDPSKGLSTNVENILGATLTGAATGFVFGAGAGEGFTGVMHGLGKVTPHLKTAAEKIFTTESKIVKTPEPEALFTPAFNESNYAWKPNTANIADTTALKKLSPEPELQTQNLHFSGDAIKEQPPRTPINLDTAEHPVWPVNQGKTPFEAMRADYSESRPKFTGRDSREHIENAWEENKGKLSNLIAEKLNEGTIPEGTFLSPLKSYSGDHLETAKAILDQAATYASDYGIMKSMKSVTGQLKNGGLDSVYYFAATPDSLGNMLAYTARKVTGHGPQIKYFDSAEQLNQQLGSKPLVIFGDLSRMSPEQKAAFQSAMTTGGGLRQEKIGIVDTSAFERLPNALDYAKGESAVRKKMDTLISDTDRIMKENPNLSRSDAVQKAIYEPNSQVIAELNAGRGNYAPIVEIRPDIVPKEEIFAARTKPEDVQKYFETKFGSTAIRERIFAAELTAFDSKFPSFGEMAHGMQTLKEGLDQSARKNGLDPSKDLYLANIESTGSSEASMLSIFTHANNIPADQIVTKNQLMEMQKNGLTNGRRVVLLDDAIYSGSQLNGYLAMELPASTFPNVAVGTLATYARYAKDTFADALIKGAEKKGFGGQDTAMLALAYKYGLNPEQLSSLKWDQINLSSGRFAVKGVAKREISGRDLDALNELKKKSNSDYVFSGMFGKAKTEETITARIDAIKKSVSDQKITREVVTNEVLVSRNPNHDIVSYARSPYDYRHTVKSLLVNDAGFGKISSLLQFPAMNADNRPSWFAGLVNMRDAPALGRKYDFSQAGDFQPTLSRRQLSGQLAEQLTNAGTALNKADVNPALDTLVNAGIPIKPPFKAAVVKEAVSHNVITPDALAAIMKNKASIAGAAAAISGQAKITSVDGAAGMAAAAAGLAKDKTSGVDAAMGAGAGAEATKVKAFGNDFDFYKNSFADLHSQEKKIEVPVEMHSFGSYEKFDKPQLINKEINKEVVTVEQIAQKIGKVPTAAEFKDALNGARVGELPKALSSTGLPQEAVFTELDKLAKSLRSLDTVLPPQKKSGLGAIDLKMPEFNIKIGDKNVSVKKIGIGEVAHVYKLTVDGESFAFKVPNDPERMDVHGSFAETGALAYLSSLEPPPKDLAKFYAGNPGSSGGWMMSDFVDKPIQAVAGETTSQALAKKGLFLGDNWSANIGPGGVIWDVGGIEPLSLQGQPHPKTFEEFEKKLNDPDFKMVAGRNLGGITSQADLKSAMKLILEKAPEASGQVARSIRLLHDPAAQYEVMSQALKTPGAAGRVAFELDKLANKFDAYGNSYARQLYYEALENPESRIEAAKQIDHLPESDRYGAFYAAWQYPEARAMAARSIPSLSDVPPNLAPNSPSLRQRALAMAAKDPGASYALSKNPEDLRKYLISQGIKPAW